MARYLATALAFFCATATAEEIPLKDIWALNMPGTRDIREHDSPDAEKSVVMKALRQVRDSWRRDCPCMVAQGEGLDAVQEFTRICTENLPGTGVSPKSPISLIFYTGGVGYYTHVEQVERDGNTFTIHYRFVPHQTRDITQHLAVIPVGMLQSGKYAVKVEQLPLREEDIDRGYGKALPRQVDRVCKSFDFIVIEER